jgi:N-acetylglucosaminyltransferase
MGMPVTGLTAALLLYATITPVYSRLQRRYAEPPPPTEEPPPWTPSVDIIVPCYNEEPRLLAACLDSLRGQRYEGPVRVWVVDDGSGNRRDLFPVLDAVTEPGWRVVLQGRNQGKRQAQAVALQEGDGEILLTIDSDTTIEPDGITRIVAPLRDPGIGAVTGDLRPSNTADSWLTRLIDTRYRLMFGRERAAQSRFGAVFCCAGPFSAYRRSAVERVWPEYVGKRRWGGQRVFGDDLELTNLVLGTGLRSVYAPSARASTSVPASLPRYLRQQARWNRSFYRELPRMLRLLPGRSRYLALDLAARTLVPALLAVGLVAAAVETLLAPERLPWHAGALVMMALAGLDLGPSPVRPEGRRFALRYGLVFVGLLLPVRLWAACTLFRNCWGTRDLPTSAGGYWARARSLRALRSPTSIPFSWYREIARSVAAMASRPRPPSRSTSAKSTCASARDSS